MKSHADSRPGRLLRLLVLSLLFTVTVLPAGQSPAADFGDDFDDNIKNKGIWGPDIVDGIGQLKEKNQHLEYIISSANQDDFILRPLYGGVGPYNADWETHIDLYNGTNPGNKKYSSFGISIIRCGKSKHELYAELYAYGGNVDKGYPLAKGFYAALFTDNAFDGDADTSDLAGAGPLTGAVRISFNSITKVFAAYYDAGGGWIPLGTFGVGGLGGINGTGNWGMDDASEFCLGVYGYSDRLTVASGAMYGDNFSSTGLTPEKVILLQPNGGEVIAPGPTPYPIEWIAPPNAQTFKLRLSVDNGLTWSLIDPNPVSGTSYDWTVTAPSKNQQQCLIKVTAYDGNDVKVGSDASDAAFTIEVVKLTSPNGGEPLISNDTHTITWTNNGAAAAQVILSYTLNNGNTWNPIDMGLDPSDDGSFDWVVPPVSGTKEKCKVKIVLKDAFGNKVGSDVSDEFFSISP